MTKVCMVVRRDFFKDAYLRRYAEPLAAAGIHVDVVCFWNGTSSAAPRRKVRIFTIPVCRTDEGGRRSLIEYGVAFILFTLWLSVLQIRNKYQVIHIHSMPDCLIFTALLPRILGAKLILDIRDPMPEVYLSKYGEFRKAGPAVRVMQAQEKLSAMLAHAVITPNPHFRENLVKRGIPASKITLVPYFPDTRIFNRSEHESKRGGNPEHFVLAYLGTVAPRYGVEVAVHAMPYLLTQISGLRLIFLGSQGAYARQMAELAHQLGVSSAVEFKPPVPVTAIPEQLVQADVGIYPGIPDPHMSIAMPMKVLEYAVMGLPIVASKLRVLEELFTDEAILFFEPGNVDRFAQCILDLYKDPALRVKLVRNADRILRDTFSWQDGLEAYFNLLNRLLGKKGASPASRLSVDPAERDVR